MITETEGIILRQTKIAAGRRMLTIFTKKYGKIAAGTNLSERSKGKQALALRPFAYGKYEIFKKGDYYNINGADTISSYYRLGEDIDKYMSASFALELCDKMTSDGEPMPALFNLTCDMLSETEKRKAHHETLLLAYEVKALKLLGYFPKIDGCVGCGGHEKVAYFSIEDGGVLCSEHDVKVDDKLIYAIDFGIVEILDFLANNPLESLKKLALDDDIARRLMQIMTNYIKYHLDITQLKSEFFVS